MEKTQVQIDRLVLVGITTRTNNAAELNPKTAKIGNLVNSYYESKIYEELKRRVAPGTTYAVYTQYASDENGDYTYFIGEQVESLGSQNLLNFNSIVIPPGTYQKFTTSSGKIPEIIISAWQEIWSMDEQNLGGKRNYMADFEVYDQRAKDPKKAVVDIYVGLIF